MDRTTQTTHLDSQQYVDAQKCLETDVQSFQITHLAPSIAQVSASYFWSLIAALIILGANTALAESQDQQVSNTTSKGCPAWMNGKLDKLHSNKQVDLCALLKGSPVLVVNTASHCGFTGQFKGLEALHQRYQQEGLVVVGFPSDDFNQEANSSDEIAEVCYKNYGVSFTMTEPVNVRGQQAIPLFRYLAEKTRTPSWNFNKYLLSPDGNVWHFPSTISPNSEELTRQIDKLLGS